MDPDAVRRSEEAAWEINRAVDREAGIGTLTGENAASYGFLRPICDPTARDARLPLRAVPWGAGVRGEGLPPWRAG